MQMTEASREFLGLIRRKYPEDAVNWDLLERLFEDEYLNGWDAGAEDIRAVIREGKE